MKIKFLLLALLLSVGNLMAQDGDTKYGNTPEEQETCKKNLSLYREYRDQKLWKQALPFWREAYKVCPASAKTLYIDGARFYSNMLDAISGDSSKLERRDGLLDTLMAIYDQRIEYFGDEGFVLGLKGVDLFKYDESRAEEAYKIMKRSIELQGNDADAIVLSVYYRALYTMFRNDKADKSDLLVEYMPVVSILDYNVAKLEDENKRVRYEKAKSNLDAFFIQIAECEDINKILGKRVAENPSDVELNKMTLAVLNKRDCTDSDLYLQVAQNVYKNDPNAAAAYSLGILMLKAKNYSQALDYFEEAANLCDDCIELTQYYLRAGQTAAIMGNTSKAKSYARKILNVDPNSGDAYILIGDAVATSAASCEDGKLGRVGAYWVAVDYYQKARSVDASVADKANQKIATYSKQFPPVKDVFFYGLKEGDPYTVECLGETTTVRVADS